MENNETNRAKQDALAVVNTITDMIKKLEQLQNEENVDISEYCSNANDMSNEEKIEALEQAIQEYPLSVNVKKIYEIELTWGGPAVRITGELDEYNQPDDVEVEYCDWFEKWTTLPLTSSQKEILLDFASHFYYEK